MKRLALKSGTVERSRVLRHAASPPEKMLWRAMRTSFPHAHFRRQVPLGVYFADFASHAFKLVIELDGETHANTDGYDAARTRFLEGEGYRVIRYWNTDVTGNLDGVLRSIASYISTTPTPNPSPQGGGELRSLA